MYHSTLLNISPYFASNDDTLSRIIDQYFSPSIIIDISDEYASFSNFMGSSLFLTQTQFSNITLVSSIKQPILYKNILVSNFSATQR